MSITLFHNQIHEHKLKSKICSDNNLFEEKEHIKSKLDHKSTNISVDHNPQFPNLLWHKNTLILSLVSQSTVCTHQGHRCVHVMQ